MLGILSGILAMPARAAREKRLSDIDGLKQGRKKKKKK
jgi:hypothetical protein